MRKRLWAAALLLLLGNVYAAPALALSCAEIPAVEEAYEKYDGVIVGQVDEVSGKNDEYNEVKVTVQRSFKGVKAEQVTLLENPTWGNLNGPSEAGETYLYFLRKTDDEQWENPLCGPSLEADKAGEELAYLEDKELPITLEPVETALPSEDGGGEKPAVDDGASDGGEQGESSSATTSVTAMAIAFIALVLLIVIILNRVIRKRTK